MLDIKVTAGQLMFDKKLIRQALRGGGNLVAQEARKLVRKSRGTGRKYGRHTASAPGATPVSRSGNLSRHIRVRAGKGKRSMRVIVSGNAWYATALEAGSKGRGIRVQEPRPFLTQALSNRREEVRRRVTEAIKKSIKFKDTL